MPCKWLPDSEVLIFYLERFVPKSHSLKIMSNNHANYIVNSQRNSHYAKDLWIKTLRFCGFTSNVPLELVKFLDSDLWKTGPNDFTSMSEWRYTNSVPVCNLCLLTALWVTECCHRFHNIRPSSLAYQVSDDIIPSALISLSLKKRPWRLAVATQIQLHS